MLLLGASGAGKSTLLAGIAGVLGGDEDGAQEGRLLVDGAEAAGARGTVGLVLQDPDSQVVLARVGDDVAFGCENLGVPREEIWPRVREALDAVGLQLPLDHPTSRLSGGQKQRLALAGVLAMRPRVLLLDEPTANLDPEGVVEVRDAVARALEITGATLVVVEHRVAVWEPLVERVVVLAPGAGVAADGTTQAVLRDRGAELAADGIWVPGHPPARLSRRSLEAGTRARLMTAGSLAVGRTREVVASRIDLGLEAGSVLAVVGPNGAGKSTLALTLAGLLAPRSGELRAEPALAGDAGPRPDRWRSAELLTRIGMVFQDPEHQFLASTVRAELEVGPRALGLDAQEIRLRVDDLLDRLRLAPLADVNPWTLSGGEKRRLSVATILATRPRLLVLDEPTFGQDRRTWQELVALLAGLRDDGCAIVAVTHDRDFVDALADEVLELPRDAADAADAARSTGTTR